MSFSVLGVDFEGFGNVTIAETFRFCSGLFMINIFFYYFIIFIVRRVTGQ